MANHPQGNPEDSVEEPLTEDDLLAREAARIEAYHDHEDQDGEEGAPDEDESRTDGDQDDDDSGEPMPSSDEDDESSDQDDVEEQDDPDDSEEESDDDDSEDDQLPPDASERTKKNFDNVLKKNKAYRRKLISLGIDPDDDDADEQFRSRAPQAGGQHVYDSVYGREEVGQAPQAPPTGNPQADAAMQKLANQNPNVSQPQFNELIRQNISTDEEGNQVINLDGLASAVAQANEAAVRNAEAAGRDAARAEISRHEEGIQLKKTYKVYPQLDPHSPDFDEKFYNRTVAILAQRQQLEKNADVQLMDVAQEAAESLGMGEQAPTSGKQPPQPKKRPKNRRQGPIVRGRGAPRKGTRRSVDQLRRAQAQGGSAGDKATLERMERAGLLDD